MHVTVRVRAVELLLSVVWCGWRGGHETISRHSSGFCIELMPVSCASSVVGCLAAVVVAYEMVYQIHTLGN